MPIREGMRSNDDGRIRYLGAEAAMTTWLDRPAGSMSRAARLRRLIEGRTTVAVPGAHDGISARLARRAGFEAHYLSGAALSASMALPDLGLITLEDVSGRAREIVRAADLPLVVDCDTGFGEALNVMHTVRRLEEAGAACMQIEDQQFPKKCGHLNDKRLIPADDMCRKVAAAKAAATDLVICARTDAAAGSLADAIARGKRYAEAGADVVFVEALASRDDIRRVRDEIRAPLLANMTEFGRTGAVARRVARGRLRARDLPGLRVPRRRARDRDLLRRPAPEGPRAGHAARHDDAHRALRAHRLLRLRSARRVDRQDGSRQALSDHDRGSARAFVFTSPLRGEVDARSAAGEGRSEFPLEFREPLTPPSPRRSGLPDLRIIYAELGQAVLRHAVRRSVFARPQQGQRGRRLASAAAIRRRIVAIELGTCRSGRSGGASGSIIFGNDNVREQRGGTSS